MKTDIRIPIYWYEDDHGNKIIDKEEMRNELEMQLKYTYLQTKKGKQEKFKKTLKEIRNEKK